MIIIHHNDRTVRHTLHFAQLARKLVKLQEVSNSKLQRASERINVIYSFMIHILIICQQFHTCNSLSILHIFYIYEPQIPPIIIAYIINL